MSGLSTHVLDAVRGEPAAGIVVRLGRLAGGEIARAVTDADGRIADFGMDSPMPAGPYRLVFETGSYLARVHGEPGERPFYPEVVVAFEADGRRARYHVPLLLSPYSYSTYRGS